MNRRILLSILLIFLVLFVLFMFSALSSDMLTKPETNSREQAVSTETGGTALLYDAFDTQGGTAQAAQGQDVTAANPLAVLVGTDESELQVFKEWCVYNKYRYAVYETWPDAKALGGASVLLCGRMPYGAAAAQTLQSYAQTGVPLIFATLPEYAALSENPELADFFGIETCVEPARKVEGLKLFADFFLSKERIYEAGDFYGDLDDTQTLVPYYTLRTGYEGYMVGLIDDQEALGIANEELPTLLWRTVTGKSQVFAVNTDLFDGERMLGVMTAFLSAASDWYLYPVVNARAIVMTDFPFLSNENAETMRQSYSRDTLGFQRDIVWPNVVKIFRNYGAVPNFFVSPQLDYDNADSFAAQDLTMYIKQIQGLNGTIGLSLMQTSGLSLAAVAESAQTHFQSELPDFRFYAAYAGAFTDEQWEAFLTAGGSEWLSELTLLLFPYRDGRAVFSFAGGQVLSALMTADGFRHETADDLQLISLMTALGYGAQHVDMDRALLPQGDADDWSRLSVLWSRGDTYQRDFAAFENTSVYGLEARVRNMLSSNFHCVREGNTLRLTADPFGGELWFVLRLHGETVNAVTGGEATRLSDTAWLIRLTQASAELSLARMHVLHPPGWQEEDTL